jgi:hypothetical protein
MPGPTLLNAKAVTTGPCEPVAIGQPEAVVQIWTHDHKALHGALVELRVAPVGTVADALTDKAGNVVLKAPVRATTRCG